MKILVTGDLHGKIEKLKKVISKYDFDFVIGVGDYSGVDGWYSYIKYTFGIKDRKKIKSPQKFYGKKKYKELLKDDIKAGKDSLLLLEGLGKPGFFVFGNADMDWYHYPFSESFPHPRKSNLNFLKKIKTIKEITYGVKQYSGISFLGFGGYLDVTANNSHRDAEWQKRVDKRYKKARMRMESLVKKLTKRSIFILHYPPLGVFDIIKDKKNKFNGGSTGIDFFRKAILEHKPLLVLCGHMHEYQGKKMLGKSLVVNPGEGSEGEFAIIDINEKKGKVKNIKFIR